MEQAQRVLYVDDDEGLCRLVSKLLVRRGYEVVAVNRGEDAVSVAQTGTFDLIAVDHYMPGMDGLATLQALKQDAACPPVIYVTGSEESRIAVAALKAGAVDYVVKSVGDDFVDLLERAFNHAFATLRLERDKAAAEEGLRAANERLETLLREVNHRVANSLQLVTTMVAMQARLLADDSAKEALADTERRIQAIAQVNRKLYTSGDVESVEMGEYLSAIIEELQATWSTPIAPRIIRLEADALKLHTDKAVSLGVVVNELVSNACKYAYGDEGGGEVRVSFRRDGDHGFRLAVEDDGCGIEVGASPRGTGLGSRLISAMAHSLASTIEYDSGHPGCRAVLVADV